MKLEEIIKSTFSLSKEFKLTENKGPGNVPGWDSLGHINLMSALESAYQITFDINEIVSLESVKDIKNVLQLKGVNNFE